MYSYCSLGAVHGSDPFLESLPDARFKDAQRYQMPAAASSTPSPSAPLIVVKSYCKDQNYLVHGRPEPSIRSMTLVYSFQGQKRWIKVTFMGTVLPADADPNHNTMKMKRNQYQDYRDFVKLIDYSLIPLLNDTVTEVVLKRVPKSVRRVRFRYNLPDENLFANLAGDLEYEIREDSQRIFYPSCDQFPSFRKVLLSELTDEEEITAVVFRVFHRGDSMHYILKVIDRPLYDPRDSDVIIKELENLERFRGVRGIVQPAGIAVSANPYATSEAGVQQLVVRGILLEFHNGGSLQRVLDEGRVMGYAWQRWPLQIATALVCLHNAKMTHMDIKASNIVLDRDGSAVLIDISGIGGITRSWLAPELQDILFVLDLPFQTRPMNDTWAFGKLLSEIASRAGGSSFVKDLNRIASRLTEENVQTRMTIPEAILRLRDWQHLE